MVTVIQEDQIAESEVWRYDDVFAVRPGEHDSGFAIWHAKKLASFYSPDTPARTNVQKVLLVEVENPDDLSVQDRLRVACSEAWKNR